MIKFRIMFDVTEAPTADALASPAVYATSPAASLI